MFRFTIRDVLWGMVAALAVGGCGDHRKAKLIQQGIEGADKHAKEIEKAAQHNANEPNQ